MIFVIKFCISMLSITTEHGVNRNNYVILNNIFFQALDRSQSRSRNSSMCSSMRPSRPTSRHGDSRECSVSDNASPAPISGHSTPIRCGITCSISDNASPTPISGHSTPIRCGIPCSVSDNACPAPISGHSTPIRCGIP